ncbi:MAG: DNA translocase FtsK, partial [Clostridia bacterium]|nr:DNA translocase FtsK [Clostridia bacterium]
MLVLLIFIFDISVKEWYSIIFNKISEAVQKAVAGMKSNKEQKIPIQVGDDVYFDSDDDFEEFDISAGELDSGTAENKDDDFDFNDIQVKEDSSLPQSPTFADEDYDIGDVDDFFENIRFDEDDLNEDEDYSIDIDIDSPMEDTHRHKKSEENVTSEDDEISLVKAEENIPDDLSDDEIFDELFDEEFMDIKESEHTAVARVAEDISRSKNNPRKSEPDQKQYDPQTVPVEENAGAALRSKKSYQYPPTVLLSEGKKSNVNYDTELKENAKKLIDTLESFSVKAKIVGYSRGPSITRYEIQPAPGVKISKITNLSDDIALNLAADGVRMEAPIPGKPAIGIEIPNKNITSVSIRELLESDEFNKNKKTKKLECVLGKDVAGKIIITDLAKMPHLLIAGTTGSGKSVCVNSILMSILFRASPDEVKMILIDPKLVEFSKYKGIPHLLIPVVSDAKKAAGALNWAVNEMEERYKEFSLYNVKDIDSYNKMVDKNLATMTEEELEEESNGEVVNGEFIPPKAKKKMPKIVIAIDELADLMMVAPGEVEESICRLAQKARAAGMHLVIATQRPSVNVITGVIKANIPSRISLKVASYVDSKTILDTGGGEKLIGRGDMLYSPVGAPKPIRVQGGFSSDDDIEAVTDFIKGHSTSDYDEEVTEQIEQISEHLGTKGGKDTPENDDIDDSDPMLEEAIKLVVDAGQASTSLLQRRLRLGYARAGRLIDTMEQMGIVGPHEGSKSRKV